MIIRYIYGAAKDSNEGANELREMQNQGHEDCCCGRRCASNFLLRTRVKGLMAFLYICNNFFFPEYQTGVISVAIEREKSLVVVVGDGVDSVSLAGSLRKKLGSATIESVQEVKAESAGKKDPIICYSQYPQYPTYAVVSDQYPSNCAIM